MGCLPLRKLALGPQGVRCFSNLHKALAAAPCPPMRMLPAGACMMMEFGYGGQILETFTPLGIVNQQKEEFLMW